MRPFARFVTLAVAAALAIAMLALPARAEYPDHPIRAIVGVPPGGGTDGVARLVSDKLAKVLGQPVVVENRGGADGNIGMDAVAKAAPDGYTLLFNSSAATVNPVMYRHLAFDPVRDLVPVAVLCEYYNLVIVNPDKVPSRDLASFVDLLRRNPGKYNFAANGARLGIELFKHAANVDVEVIPYRGASDAIVALLRGDADFMIINAPGLGQHLASGKLRAIATTAPSRQTDFPDVATTAESGFPQYDYASFFGAYVPAATPLDVRRRLNAALNAVAAMPDVVAQFRTNGATAVQSTLEGAAQRYLGDIAKYKAIVDSAHIPPVD